MAPELLARVAYYFCHGFSADAVAKTIGLSRKTVRDIFIDLREQLLKPKFSKWHRSNRALVGVSSIETQIVIRAAFFDVLAECGMNGSCQRNFDAGNRKTRLCRGCPLPGKFSSAERVSDALTQIDAVREFYRRIKIHGETENDPVSLFRKRLIHTVIVLTAVENGKRLPSGLLDPAHQTDLSFGTLVRTLMEDLTQPQPGKSPP